MSAEEKLFYNEEQKNKYLRYIDEKNSDKPNSNLDKSITGMFKRVASSEEYLKKDLCQMKTDEIVGMIVSFNLSQKTSIFYKNIIHKYIEWCINEGYCKVDYLDKRFLSLAEFKDALKDNDKAIYINPDMYNAINSYLKTFPNYDYDGTIFAAVYDGLLLEELPELRLSDIDDKKLTVKTQRGEITVSKELINKLYHTATVDKIQVKNKEYFRSLNFKRHFDSVFYFQNPGTVEENANSLRRRLNKVRINLAEEFEFSRALSVQDVANSGILNYMILKAKENDVDIVSDLRDKEYRYKYDVAERDYYYELALKEKCLGYNIGLLRVRMEFMLENI